MTKSIIEKNRKRIVRNVIKHNFEHVPVDAIKLKLNLKNALIKNGLTNNEKENIRKLIALHLAELTKATKIFEYKIIIFLSDYNSMIHTNGIYVYTYNQSHYLGRLHLSKIETKIIQSTTTGRILSDKKNDFLNELSKTPFESFIRFFIFNPRNKKYKAPFKTPFISESLYNINNTLLNLKKESIYNDFIKKYQLDFNFSFNIGSKQNNIEAHSISKNKDSFIRKMFALITHQNDFNHLPESNKIESTMIQSLIKNGYLNHDAYLIYLDDNTLSLVDLIEHNDILGY